MKALILFACLFLFSCEQEYVRCYKCITVTIADRPIETRMFTTCSSADDFEELLEAIIYEDGITYKTICEEIK